MTSQLVISELFYLFFFVPPTLGLKFFSSKSTNKKNLALPAIEIGLCFPHTLCGVFILQKNANNLDHKPH